jgi:superfamily II DNA helicase RecQ
VFLVVIVYVFHYSQKILGGYYSIIVVAPESLDSAAKDRDAPRIGRAIRQERQFAQRIRQVLIDEAHLIYIDGCARHTRPAYRAAYANLGLLRIFLGTGTPFQALSGTLPPHVKKFVINSLGFGSTYVSITYSSNRPNVTLASRPLLGAASGNDLRNLSFLIPPKHKGVVFFDNRDLAADAANHLSSLPLLPPNVRVCVYHSSMSARYLEATFQSFDDPAGDVWILCATASVATVCQLTKNNLF